jgi:cephalosporin hydroxylase
MMAMSVAQEPEYRIINDAEEIAAIAQQAQTPLEKIYFQRTGPVSMKWRHYLALYDRYLSGYREKPTRFLEIGVADGGSFPMWRKYFGAQAKIFGIDVDPESCKKVEALELDCHARAGSQADPSFLQSVVTEMGGLDIVIDDGSHIAEHQVASFKTLFPLLSNGGVYVCEDLHTAYWDGWQGGYKRPGTFIEVIKDMIDSIHTWYYPIENELREMELHRHVPGIHLHDSMVVIEKNDVVAPVVLIK